MPCKACIEPRKRRQQRLADKATRGDNGITIIVPQHNQSGDKG